MGQVHVAVMNREGIRFLTEGYSETRSVSIGGIHSKMCLQNSFQNVFPNCVNKYLMDNNKLDEVMLKEKVAKSMTVAKALWRSEDECCN